jgi:hypothetical protein
MINKTIQKLNNKLNKSNADVCKIESELQTAWNKVFDKSKAILDAMAKLQSSTDFTYDGGEIASYIRFCDLSDFQECRQYFETYMRDTHFVTVEWENECLLYGQGESITIQDDTRHDNGVWLNSKCIINESEYKSDGEVNETKRNALIEAYMDRNGYFPGVFRTDSHGNVFSINTLG